MVLTDPRQIDAAWIAQALQRAGVAPAGAVQSVAVETDGARSWSRIVRVRVDYHEGLAGRLPERLLVKLCGAEGGVFGRSEVDYYRRDYVGAADAPLPRCFDAAFDDATRHYHLLLEDLSDSHVNGDQVQPDEAFGRALVDSLAALHAHGRVAAAAAASGPGVSLKADIERYVAHVSSGLEPLLDRVGDTLAPPWPARLRRLFATLAERFAARVEDPRGLTLVHGDLNPGNLLVPRDRRGPVLFIDRQPFDWSLTRWLGACDLAYAIVPWWDSGLRRRLEGPLLQHYHAALQARGVDDMPLEQLHADYRLGIEMAIAVAVEWCVLESDRDRMRWLWSVQLQRALAAYDDGSIAATP